MQIFPIREVGVPCVGKISVRGEVRFTVAGELHGAVGLDEGFIDVPGSAEGVITWRFLCDSDFCLRALREGVEVTAAFRLGAVEVGLSPRGAVLLSRVVPPGDPLGRCPREVPRRGMSF